MLASGLGSTADGKPEPSFAAKLQSAGLQSMNICRLICRLITFIASAEVRRIATLQNQPSPDLQIVSRTELKAVLIGVFRNLVFPQVVTAEHGQTVPRPEPIGQTQKCRVLC